MIILLDIVLVAAIFYVLLAWLRVSIPQSTSRRIMFTIPIIASIYVLARAFDLYMLEWVIQVLAIVVLIGLVVVFQTDIRRMLDRAIGKRSHRRGQESHESAVVNVLTEASAKMAEMNMGALIAIRGREPWDGHIQGGVELRGVISQPLLYSLFHPATPGHDGAVLIENGRIVKFAAHLPLAPDLPEISQFGGTRHAAALGLSEECDAFVIVVSEEQGAVSIAEGGKLSEAVTASELKQRLEQFWRQHYHKESDEHPSWWKKPNLQVALLSVVLAVMVWLIFVYSPIKVQRTFRVPVELQNLPQNWAVEGDVPDVVNVILSGSPQVFQRLNPEELALSIDLSDPRTDPIEISIAEEDLNLPAGIDLEDANPSFLRIQVVPMVSIRVPVRVRTTGMLPDTLELVDLHAEPDSIALMVPEQTSRSVREVYTETIHLDQITESGTIQVRYIPPSDARLLPDASTNVEVEVTVRSRNTPVSANGIPEEARAGWPSLPFFSDE